MPPFPLTSPPPPMTPPPRDDDSEPAADLRALLDRMPTVAEVRLRIVRNRAEAKLLRRLLKLATDAEAADPATSRGGGEGDR